MRLYVCRPQVDYEPADWQEDADDDDDVAGASVQSAVTAVRGVLPELGRGFVTLCLDALGHDVERVIDAVLEARLPAHLVAVDPTLDSAHDTSAAVNDLTAQPTADHQVAVLCPLACQLCRQRQ